MASHLKLGSAPDGGLLSSIPCACFAHGVTTPLSCKKVGKQVCGACLLVEYCSKECQKAHWPVHKLSCKSPLADAKWLPKYVAENRNLDFLDPEKSHYYTNFCWGNRAAFDSLKLGVNEGDYWDKYLDLCFVDSGDLRSIILSVNNLPQNFRGKCSITFCDIVEDACTRDLLLLLTFSSYPPEQAAEIAIHLWYSATLPHDVSESLKTVIQSRLNDKVFKDLPTTPSGEVIASDVTRSFKLGIFAEIEATFSGSLWASISCIFSNWMTPEQALKARKEKVLRKGRSGFKEQLLYGLSPYYRVAKNQFDQDGLVLPFGAYRKHFTDPNFTLLPVIGLGWLPSDNADPLHGWDFSSILKTGKESSVPRNDIYGALYFHLRKEFVEFSRRLRTMNLQFTLFGNKQFNDFAKIIAMGNCRFDRIDLTGVTERTVKTMELALELFGPLLKPIETNPHAAIITLVCGYQYHMKRPYLNIMMDIMMRFEDSKAVPQQIFPDPDPSRERDGYSDPYKLRVAEIQLFMVRWEPLLREWEKDSKLGEMARRNDLEKRVENKIMDMWPGFIDGSKSIPGMAKQLTSNTLMRSDGNECYMEWHHPRPMPAPKVVLGFEDAFGALLAEDLGI